MTEHRRASRNATVTPPLCNESRSSGDNSQQEAFTSETPLSSVFSLWHGVPPISRSGRRWGPTQRTDSRHLTLFTAKSESRKVKCVNKRERRVQSICVSFPNDCHKAGTTQAESLHNMNPFVCTLPGVYLSLRGTFGLVGGACCCVLQFGCCSDQLIRFSSHGAGGPQCWVDLFII